MSLESGGLNATLTPLSPGYCLSGVGPGRGVIQCWFPQRGMSLPCQVRFVLGIRSRTRLGGRGSHPFSCGEWRSRLDSSCEALGQDRNLMLCYSSSIAWALFSPPFCVPTRADSVSLLWVSALNIFPPSCALPNSHNWVRHLSSVFL